MRRFPYRVFPVLHGTCPQWWGGLCVLAVVAALLPLPAHAAETPKTTSVNELSGDAQQGANPLVYDQSLSVSTIAIYGNRLVSTERIVAQMSLKPGVLYSKKALQEDLKRIYELGYFTENMKATPKATAQGIVLTLVLEENLPVSAFHFKGNEHLPASAIEGLFASQLGLPQNLQQLNETITQLEALYKEKGYVLAKVVDIGDAPDGSVTLTVDEGHIEKIAFVGNRKTKDFVIKRALSFKEGDVYNEKAMSEDLKRLYATQAFEDVRRSLSPSPRNPQRYQVVVEVDEKRSGAFNLGGGVDSISGFFGSTGYTDPNFLGRGESLNISLGVGSGVLGRDRTTQANARSYQVDLGWSTPAFLQKEVALSTNLYGRDFSSFSVPLSIERRLGGSITLAKALEKINPALSASLGLKYEQVSLREGVSLATIQGFFPSVTAADRAKQNVKANYLSLNPNLAFDTRDNQFDPSSGWLSTLGLGGFLGINNPKSVKNYATISANVRKYIKLSNYVTLALNAQGSSSVFGDIPDVNAFSLGGAYSVRGYQVGGLGVGSGFALGSAELRMKLPMLAKAVKKVPFLDSLRLVAFADAGTLFRPSEFNDVYKRRGEGFGAGLGLRITIPGLGPLRLDYAWPLLGVNKQFRQRVNFGIGQKF